MFLIMKKKHDFDPLKKFLSLFMYIKLKKLMFLVPNIM